MRTSVKVSIIFILNLFHFILPMGEIKECSKKMPYFDFFQQLYPEIQEIIFMYYIEDNEITCDTIFENIIQSYKNLKSIAHVSKAFRSLEQQLMNNYRKRLKEILSKYSMQINMSILFHLLLDQDTTKDECDYHNLLLWLAPKEANLLKSVLIIFRLGNTTASECSRLKEIWSKFENQNSLLHLACYNGNLDLTKYLLNPKISKYFGIDSNKLDKNNLTTLMQACMSPEKNRNSGIIQLLLNEKVNPEAVTRTKKLKIVAISKNSIEDYLNGKAGSIFVEYTASDLAKQRNYLEAYELIEKHRDDIEKSKQH